MNKRLLLFSFILLVGCKHPKRYHYIEEVMEYGKSKFPDSGNTNSSDLKISYAPEANTGMNKEMKNKFHYPVIAILPGGIGMMFGNFIHLLV